MDLAVGPVGLSGEGDPGAGSVVVGERADRDRVAGAFQHRVEMVTRLTALGDGR
jgi:hypothetical protein